MRVYVTVFLGLAVLTAITVYACYGLKLPVHTAIIVALIIASIKASLVIWYFMHVRLSSALTKLFVAAGFFIIISYAGFVRLLFFTTANHQRAYAQKRYCGFSKKYFHIFTLIFGR